MRGDPIVFIGTGIALQNFTNVYAGVKTGNDPPGPGEIVCRDKGPL